MGTYSIHVPCRLLALATHLSPPSIRRLPRSAHCTLQQTSHPDPDSCPNICSMRATSHGACSSQQSSSTTLTYMLRTSFKAWGTTASISQRYPSTHQQKKILVRAQARCPLPQANPRRTRALATPSPGPTPLKLLNLGRADGLQLSVLFHAGEVWIRPSLKCPSTSSSECKICVRQKIKKCRVRQSDDW
jgi:hypothetical protein